MKVLVLGAGLTGQSAIKFCRDKGDEVFVYESSPSNEAHIASSSALINILPNINLVIASPGFDPKGGVIQECLKELPGSRDQVAGGRKKRHKAERQKNELVISDIELFARHAKAPIIAITGTNGKSTVATMVHQMLLAAGKKALLGGNIGIAALGLLDEPVPDFYVLELSSFQLELTQNLKSISATVLNISPDHLDRHGDLNTYQQIKETIFAHCEHPVLNAQMNYLHEYPDAIYFDIDKPFLDLSAYQLSRHDQANALAALRLCEAAGVEVSDCLPALTQFESLPHRCQLIPTTDGKFWINDSKGTNVGATIAAIESVTAQYHGKCILILGGVGKGQDFRLLNFALKHVDECVVFGRDKDLIAKAISVKSSQVETLEEAVKNAHKKTQTGDVILFSPACASFDQFKNFQERGDQLKSTVSMLGARSRTSA